jgi:3-oxoacyl-[acyl-carrier-protein] synthase-1
MVSALGLDVVTSCAAARAGITNIGALDDQQAFDAESGELVPLAGNQVPFISVGLFGFARLLQLSLGAIEDLVRGRAADPQTRMGLILVVRSEWHRRAVIERLKADPSGAGESRPKGFPVSSATFDEVAMNADQQRLASSLLASVVARAGVAVEPRARRTILGDQNGFIAALKQADAWFAEGACDACWIGGIDSYLDPPIVGALAGLQLLRTPSNPVGLYPGEMACFLEVRKAGRRKGADAVAHVEALAEETGTVRAGADAAPDPEPLVRAITAASSGQGLGFRVVNLNGTPQRALEWGMAMTHRQMQGLRDDGATWIPPLHFGEIGSATGPASIALLARGWARGYAPGGSAIVCLMEDGPKRGAISVSGPQ